MSAKSGKKIINTFLVLVSGAVVLFFMWMAVDNSAKKLTGVLETEIQASVINQTTNFFSAASASNRGLAFMYYNYFNNPLKNQNTQQTLFDYFRELMSANSQYKMIYYADTTGDLILLSKMPDNTFSKRVVRNNGREVRITWEHENPVWLGSFYNTVDPAASGYDPRKRGWYGLAERTRAMTWTPVYLTSEDNLPGFTCTIPIYDDRGRLSGVSSIDISAVELSLFLGTVRPTPGTKIFIADKNNNIAALQAQTEYDLEKLHIQNEDRQGVLTYNMASISTLYDENSRFLLETLLESKNDSLSIDIENKIYMTSRVLINAGDGLELFLYTIIPEDEVAGNARITAIAITAFFCFMLIITIRLTVKEKSESVPEKTAPAAPKSDPFNEELQELDELRKVYEFYETGLTHYFKKNWAEGLKYFNGILKYRPNDIPAKLLRGRCQQYLSNPTSQRSND
ncbi:MAG: cache domain-containing protein [Treponema sp.]|jgi:hypothetical protein|nr:cache domain-containing protein [Treponema sp.]